MSDAVVLTVNLLKCQLLGLADEAEDQAPGYQVQSCVEADCVACQWGSIMVSSLLNLQAPTCVIAVTIAGNVKPRIPAKSVVSNSPRYRHTSKRLTKGVVDAHSPCHALLTLDGGEHLSGVLESYWTFSHRVHDGEQVYESAILVSFGRSMLRYDQNLQYDGTQSSALASSLRHEQ